MYLFGRMMYLLVLFQDELVQLFHLFHLFSKLCQCTDIGVCHGFGFEAFQFSNHSKFSYSFRGDQQTALLLFAYNGIQLPIANPFLFINNRWSVLDTDSVRYFSARPNAAAFFAVGFGADTQMFP